MVYFDEFKVFTHSSLNLFLVLTLVQIGVVGMGTVDGQRYFWIRFFVLQIQFSVEYILTTWKLIFYLNIFTRLTKTTSEILKKII